MKKIILSIIGISLLLILMSCGNNSKNHISLPEKSDMNFPQLLQKTEEESNQEDENIDGNYAYIELKERIDRTEKSKQSFKIDMLLAEQLMPDIVKKCEDIPLYSTCTIEENQLFFIYNEEIIEEIIKLMGESYRKHIIKMKNKKIPLGEVKFAQYSDSETYQYFLSIEYIPDIKNMTYTKESMKWSKDEKSISSFYSSSNSKSNYSMKIEFFEKEDNTQEMRIKDNFFNVFKDDTFQANFELNITERGDENETYNFSSIEKSLITSNGESNTYLGSSVGFISNKGGSLLYTEEYEDSSELRKERNIFNANGKILKNIYCSTQFSCNMNDESTWLENSNGTSCYSGVIPIPEGIPLKLVGGNLQKGSYRLLIPNTDIENKSTDEIDNDLSVGLIYIDNNTIDAILFDDKYKKELDQLVIVREIFTEEDESSFMKISFELIPIQDRPTLELLE